MEIKNGKDKLLERGGRNRGKRENGTAGREEQ